MRAPQKLRDLAISESGFVFDPYTGATFSLNEPGLLALTALRDGLDRDGVLTRLASAFEIQPGLDIGRDLDEFLLSLRLEGLVPDDYRA